MDITRLHLTPLDLALADWLRAARPDVRAVDTWNDTTNAPMLAVND